jgi:hypothetical protein
MRSLNQPRHARRSLWAPLFAGVLLTTALSAAALSLGASPASAAVLSVGQCNNVGPDAAGATTGMTCTVTVVNNISPASTSSTTTLTRQCSLGACPGGNGTFTSSSTDLVTDITQCNGSDNDAAHPISCTVNVTNNISVNTPGAAPVTAATVNQCVGSAQGGGGTVNCSPFPATTSGATVTQCNGSANGGGGTVDCAVGSASTVAPAVPVRVNQCNGTGNPGGTVLTCRTTITTNITAAAGGTPTPTATASTSATATPTGSSAPVVTTPAPVPTTAATAVPGATTPGTTTVPVDTTGAGGPPQVVRVPAGGVPTGGGSTAGIEDRGLFGAGALLLLMGALIAVRRRRLSLAAASRCRE